MKKEAGAHTQFLFSFSRMKSILLWQRKDFFFFPFQLVRPACVSTRSEHSPRLCALSLDSRDTQKKKRSFVNGTHTFSLFFRSFNRARSLSFPLLSAHAFLSHLFAILWLSLFSFLLATYLFSPAFAKGKGKKNWQNCGISEKRRKMSKVPTKSQSLLLLLRFTYFPELDAAFL